MLPFKESLTFPITWNLLPKASSQGVLDQRRFATYAQHKTN